MDISKKRLVVLFILEEKINHLMKKIDNIYEKSLPLDKSKLKESFEATIAELKQLLVIYDKLKRTKPNKKESSQMNSMIEDSPSLELQKLEKVILRF